MATEWFLRSFDDEFGPIAFSELVDLVRNGTVVGDDLLRSSTSNRQQRADSIIGLFYMARRPVERLDLVCDSKKQAHTDSEQLESAMESPFTTNAADTRPEWLIRLMEARDHHSFDFHHTNTSSSESSIATREVQEDPLDTLPNEEQNFGFTSELGKTFGVHGQSPDGTLNFSTGRWSSIVDDALTATDRRESARRGAVWGPGWLFARRMQACIRFVNRLGDGKQLLGLIYRLLAGVICANLTAIWVMSWSSQEALRFPSRTKTSVHMFPLIGACGDQEYLFWLFDAAIGTGFLAYWGTSILVAKAES